MGKNRTKINHAYNFAGGDKLKTMGAAWFVGFCYAKFVNPLYDKWIYGESRGLRLRVKTFAEILSQRLCSFSGYEKEPCNREMPIVEFFLRKTLDMEDLDKSDIDETSDIIKQYANEILDRKLIFEGVLSGLAMNSQNVYFKLKGTDGFYVIKQEKENDKEIEKKYNLFLEDKYSEARLIPDEAEFCISSSNAMKDLLISACQSQKKIYLELSLIGVLSFCNREMTQYNFEQIIHLVEI